MARSRAFRADSLAVGISVMLVLTVVQRALGFGRGIWFCRLLDDASLGKWAMGFGFLTLVSPIMLLGIPGSLPRFIDVYLQRGQLRPYLTRIMGVTLCLVAIGIGGMLLFSDALGRAVFDEDAAWGLVASMAFALVCVIAFNVTTEIVGGLRQVRITSVAHFVHSVSFAILGVAWLSQSGRVPGLITVFGISALLGCLPAWWALMRGWESTRSTGAEPFNRRAMWKRVLPYAATIWSMNLLSNTFDMTDRYMLLHLSPGGTGNGQSAVGQYHSAMIVPMLMISVSHMISGVLLPYLSADWEAGRREQVIARLRSALAVICLGFTAGSAVAMMLAPWLYEVILDNAYGQGLAVLPICLLFCIWRAVGFIAQTYLYVTEKGRWVAVVMAAGLAANVVLNALLVPAMGLRGAVWATCLANLVVLAGIWVANHRAGYRAEWATCWITLAPVSLLAGGPTALIVVAVIAVTSPILREYLTILQRLAGCQRSTLPG